MLVCQCRYTASSVQARLVVQVSTVVLRASTDNTLDDLERAVDDGVNAYKVSRFHKLPVLCCNRCLHLYPDDRVPSKSLCTVVSI